MTVNIGNAGAIATHSVFKWELTVDGENYSFEAELSNSRLEVVEHYVLEENSDGVYFYRNGDEFLVFKNTNQYLAVDYARSIDALIVSLKSSNF